MSTSDQRVEFKPWPKTPRLYRDITITEKIDGTNAAVQIVPLDLDAPVDLLATAYVESDGIVFAVYAQSRKRIITPGDDNAGFARWVEDYAVHIVKTLGPGVHFGEWWGQGIQRNYGMTEKRFSLFNTSKWGEVLSVSGDGTGLAVVPVLYEGRFGEVFIQECLDDLEYGGSYVADFDRPEGIVVYHHAANDVFKVLLENDEYPKGIL